MLEFAKGIDGNDYYVYDIESERVYQIYWTIDGTLGLYELTDEEVRQFYEQVDCGNCLESI